MDVKNIPELNELNFDTRHGLKIGAIADLGQAVPVPRGVPWFPQDIEAWSVRWVLLHLVEYDRNWVTWDAWLKSFGVAGPYVRR